MKPFPKPLILLFLFYLQWGTNMLFAEGTKQLNPTAANPGNIQIIAANGSGSTFAAYTSTATQRLYIHICTPGETVYMGFNSRLPAKFRVKQPDGTIAFPENNVPVASDTNGTIGKISNHAQAVIGPNVLNPSGYVPLSFTATQTGDYYIEFDISARTGGGGGVDNGIDLFDITVLDTSGNQKNGRLWSQAWMINSGSLENQFDGSMYIYTTDQIVTKVDMNGIQPYEFIISSNNTGTNSTGNAAADRMSKNGNVTMPLYKIFLNDPDTLCYPTGDLGSLDGTPTLTGCPGNYCINVKVTAAGEVFVLIDLNGVPDYQAGTKDRIMQFTLKKGINCLPWNGLDGQGQKIIGSSKIKVDVKYINGITHLPIFDVEKHKRGYEVSYVRPLLPGINSVPLFWDDSGIGGGKSPINGCTGGCHTWTTSSGNGDNSIANNRTLNTWWYVAQDTSAIAYNYVQQDIDANRSTAGNGKLNDTTVCASTKEIVLKGSLSGDTISKWTKLTGSGIIKDADTLTTLYTLSNSDANLASVKLVLSSVNLGGCPIVRDTITINLEPLPKLTMPAPFQICSNNIAINTSASILNVGGIAWKSGEGKFLDSLKTTIQYTPSQKELDSSYVKFHARTLPKLGQLCPMIEDSVKISVYMPATLKAPTDTIVCQPSTSINLTLKAISTASDSVVWLSNSVVPVPKKGLTSSFALTNGNAFSVFLTAYKKGCNPIKDTVTVKFEAQPIITASQTDTCSPDMRVKLSGTTSLGAVKGTATWTSTGTGSFLLNKDSLTNAYIPSKLDSTTGQVSLKLSSKGQVFCPAKETSLIYKIIPLPKASAVNDSLVCINSPINLTSTQNADWKYEWRRTKSGSVLSATNKLSFSANQDTNQVYLKVLNSRNCEVSDSAEIATVRPPTIALQPNLCLYSAKNIVATVTNAPSAGTYEWKLNNIGLGISNASLPINKAGNYSYHFSFNNGCTSSASMQAFDVPKLQVEDTSACLNGKTALIANLIPNATYSWGTPAITNSSNKFDITVTAPIPSFKVLVVDQNNCKDSTDVQISISPSPIFSLNGLDLCEGETKKLITTLDPLSNIPLSYSWTRNGVPISTSKWEELAYTQAGNYTLKLGIKGCFETKSKVIKANPTPKINMPLVYKHCFETDPSLSLNAEVFKKYTWLSDGNVLDTTQNIKVAPEQDTDYILKVENSFGCKDSTKLLVRKVCAPRLFVPNVITPESDDINSKLRIFGANYTNFEITVFNRWGEVIFHSKDPDNAWTGEYLNSKMPIGNYQWQVKYEGDTEEYRGPYKKTGDVAIIR